MSGTTSSWSHANVRPVRARPDWISSATISTCCSRHSVAHAAQVALGRDDHAGLALHRLEQHGHGGVVDRRTQRVDVAVRDEPEARRVRRVALGRVGVGRERHDRRGAAVEVALHRHDRRLVLRDALDLVAPLAAHLDRGLDGLGAGVHRQDHVLAGELGERLRERPELVVVERAAGQRQPAELLAGDLDQARVAVPEVERGVAREAVEVALAVDVGHPRAVAGREHHGQRVVVVRGVRLGELDVVRGAGRGRGSWGCFRGLSGRGRGRAPSSRTHPPAAK